MLVAAAAGYLAGARDLRPAVMQTDRDFDLAVSQRGVEAWVSYFADDGAMTNSAGTIVRGHEGVRKLMAPLFGDKEASLRWQPDFAEVAKSGDLAYTTGPAKFRGRNPQGKRVERDSRYLTVWRRQKDGSWKVAFDIGTSGPVRIVE